MYCKVSFDWCNTVIKCGACVRGSILGAYVPVHHAKFLKKHKKQNLSCKIGEGILKHLLKSVTGEGSL